MQFEDFQDVHPNWSIVESLDREESHATLDLLLMAVYLDERLTADEVEVLTEEWKQLPCVGPPESADQLADRMLDTHASLTKIAETPKLFWDFIAENSNAIEGDEQRIAVFRLVAMAALADEASESELTFCYALGYELGFDLDTVEHLLRSIWESHESTANLERAFDDRVPPIRGHQWAREHTLKPYPDPFSTRVDST